jgi:hypothetical protein
MEALIKKIDNMKSVVGDMKIKMDSLDPSSNLSKPPVPKIPGVQTPSAKTPIKIAEQSQAPDPQMKEAQKKVARDGQKIMVKFEAQEILKTNEFGQWSLGKSYDDNTRFHMHQWNQVKGKGPRLTASPKTRQELMSDPVYGRADQKPHANWGAFVEHHRQSGYAPVKV